MDFPGLPRYENDELVPSAGGASPITIYRLDGTVLVEKPRSYTYGEKNQ